MNWKKLFVYSASLIYLILISLFLYFFKIDFICGYEKPCLRFCSTDTEKYSDEMLFDELMNSSFTYWFGEDYNLTNIFRGPPLCNNELKVIGNLTNKKDDLEDVDDEDNDDETGRLSIYQVNL